LMLKVHIYIYIYIYLTNSVFLFAWRCQDNYTRRFRHWHSFTMRYWLCSRWYIPIA
jgi:hypothetical protein